MTAHSQLDTKKLADLISLLSCHELDAHEVRRIVDLCVHAQAQPLQTLAENYGQDAAQVAEHDPQGVIAFILFIELEDYFAAADNVDEIHEQVIDAFAQPTLPTYPYDDNNFETVSDYYQWLDQQLQIHHAKYCLISFGESYSHDFQLILVYRDKLADILSLCRELGLQAHLCE